MPHPRLRACRVLSIALAACAPLGAEAQVDIQGAMEVIDRQVGGNLRCADAYKVVHAAKEDHDPTTRLESLARYRQCLTITQGAAPARAPVAQIPKRGPTDYSLSEGIAAAELQRVETDTPGTRGDVSFMGISFGVGIGLSWGGFEEISEAQVGAGNVVVVTRRAKQQPRIILETHYYGVCNWFDIKRCKAGELGFGPYFGIVAKSDKLISAASIGLMVGFRTPSGPDSTGFSIGIGAILDDAVPALAAGFAEGQPLPAGETTIRFTQKERWGAILFCSRTF